MKKLCVLALASLLTVSGAACRKRSPADVAPAEAPKAVPAPVANAAATPQRNAEEILGAMNEALRNYMAEKGRMPASVEELYVAHASKQIQPPDGKHFTLNPKLMAVEYR
ncbi:MAG: hypothetical protein B9S33_11670 [Pedosphaera sp. Tous-C6FEB]|nr:MAG: hypothetical protein B9S33_11670 [Pedosphaera sp. Tous-C6FEB]